MSSDEHPQQAPTGAENWLRELEQKLTDQGTRLTAIEEHMTTAPDLGRRVAAIEERLSAETSSAGTGEKTHAMALGQVYKILAERFPSETGELRTLLHINE
jgi:hypothetical protein